MDQNLESYKKIDYNNIKIEFLIIVNQKIMYFLWKLFAMLSQTRSSILNIKELLSIDKNKINNLINKWANYELWPGILDL